MMCSRASQTVPFQRRFFYFWILASSREHSQLNCEKLPEERKLEGKVAWLREADIWRQEEERKSALHARLGINTAIQWMLIELRACLPVGFEGIEGRSTQGYPIPRVHRPAALHPAHAALN
ncbi:unnamed protein product [Nezara viridula]|uniref:Uncharacterized protein n=1 Tax=Nezara viridula TaxID=85310 RepID=A0A9P0HRV2_NEZVI|nr:unnamed protein product [Nezara viridula]